MVESIQEMQWVLRAQCDDREALEALLRSVQPSLGRYLTGLAGAFRSGNTNLVVHKVMLMLGVWMMIQTLVVVIQITVMAKRILRAIELASQK